MVILQTRARRKPTGGRYNKKLNHKRKHEMGRAPSLIKLGGNKIKGIRTMGGNCKLRPLSMNVLNAVDKKTNAYKKVKITSILESPANEHYVRRNIITKGAIVQTDAGKAKITNRPGQDGMLNGELL